MEVNIIFSIFHLCITAASFEHCISLKPDLFIYEVNPESKNELQEVKDAVKVFIEDFFEICKAYKNYKDGLELIIEHWRIDEDTLKKVFIESICWYGGLYTAYTTTYSESGYPQDLFDIDERTFCNVLCSIEFAVFDILKILQKLLKIQKPINVCEELKNSVLIHGLMEKDEFKYEKRNSLIIPLLPKLNVKTAISCINLLFLVDFPETEITDESLQDRKEKKGDVSHYENHSAPLLGSTKEGNVQNVKKEIIPYKYYPESLLKKLDEEDLMPIEPSRSKLHKRLLCCFLIIFSIGFGFIIFIAQFLFFYKK